MRIFRNCAPEIVPHPSDNVLARGRGHFGKRGGEVVAGTAAEMGAIQNRPAQPAAKRGCRIERKQPEKTDHREKRCGFGAVSGHPQQTSHPRRRLVHAWDRALANRGPSNELSALGSSNSARTRSTSISSRSWVFRRTRSFSVV